MKSLAKSVGRLFTKGKAFILLNAKLKAIACFVVHLHALNYRSLSVVERWFY